MTQLQPTFCTMMYKLFIWGRFCYGKAERHLPAAMSLARHFVWTSPAAASGHSHGAGPNGQICLVAQDHCGTNPKVGKSSQKRPPSWGWTFPFEWSWSTTPAIWTLGASGMGALSHWSSLLYQDGSFCGQNILGGGTPKDSFPECCILGRCWNNLAGPILPVSITFFLWLTTM